MNTAVNIAKKKKNSVIDRGALVQGRKKSSILDAIDSILSKDYNFEEDPIGLNHI